MFMKPEIESNVYLTRYYGQTNNDICVAFVSQNKCVEAMPMRSQPNSPGTIARPFIHDGPS